MNLEMDTYEVTDLKPNWALSLITLLAGAIFIGAIASGLVNIDGSDAGPPSSASGNPGLVAERLTLPPATPVMTIFLVDTVEQHSAVMAEQMTEADRRYGEEEYRFDVLVAGTPSDAAAAAVTIDNATRRWKAIDPESTIAIVDLRASTENDD